jgi:hypothetical protein
LADLPQAVTPYVPLTLNPQLTNKLKQGRAAAAAGDWRTAEGCFLQGGAPDLALGMYRGEGMWDDAIRVAEGHLPSKVRHMAHQ